MLRQEGSQKGGGGKTWKSNRPHILLEQPDQKKKKKGEAEYLSHAITAIWIWILRTTTTTTIRIRSPLLKKVNTMLSLPKCTYIYFPIPNHRQWQGREDKIELTGPGRSAIISSKLRSILKATRGPVLLACVYVCIFPFPFFRVRITTDQEYTKKKKKKGKIYATLCVMEKCVFGFRGVKFI